MYSLRSRRVALLAEGVDRNRLYGEGIRLTARSPSSRRAWIEILPICVDVEENKSPSSRRAWIEIAFSGTDAADWVGRPPRGGRG